MLLLALVGCGGEPLSREDELDVAAAVGNLSFYCSELRLFPKEAPKDVDRLIAIYQKDPDAIYQEGHEEDQTMRGVLEAVARNLARKRCDPGLAKRIRRAL